MPELNTLGTVIKSTLDAVSDTNLLTDAERAQLAALPSEGFSPDQIADLALWLDASDETTINAGSPSDDDPISLWADKSPSGYDAAQATSDNQPIYKTNIQNGLSVIRFDPSVTDRFLDLSGSGLDLFRNVDAITCALVSKGDGSPILYASTADGTQERVYMAPAPSGSAFNWNSDDVGSPLFIESLLDYPPSFTAGMVSADGITGMAEAWGFPYIRVDPAGYDPAPTAFIDAASQFIRFGGYPSGPSHLTGDVAEILVWHRFLHRTERVQVLDYLTAKWGILSLYY